MQWPELADAAEWGFLALRVVIGVIFVVHGWPKITGGKQMAEAMSGEPNPGVATMLTVQGVVELAAGILVGVGLITQIAVIPLMIIMIGAIILKIVQIKTGFSSMEATGWEFDLVILAGLVLLFLAGPGDLAIQA
jgi:putative oxidoreductase